MRDLEQDDPREPIFDAIVENAGRVCDSIDTVLVLADGDEAVVTAPFSELDHAAAAAKVGLQLRPRTVVVFGNPKLGTGPMQKTYCV